MPFHSSNFLPEDRLMLYSDDVLLLIPDPDFILTYNGKDITYALPSLHSKDDISYIFDTLPDYSNTVNLLVQLLHYDLQDDYTPPPAKTQDGEIIPQEASILLKQSKGTEGDNNSSAIKKHQDAAQRLMKQLIKDAQYLKEEHDKSVLAKEIIVHAVNLPINVLDSVAHLLSWCNSQPHNPVESAPAAQNIAPAPQNVPNSNTNTSSSSSANPSPSTVVSGGGGGVTGTGGSGVVGGAGTSVEGGVSTGATGSGETGASTGVVNTGGVSTGDQVTTAGTQTVTGDTEGSGDTEDSVGTGGGETGAGTGTGNTGVVGTGDSGSSSSGSSSSSTNTTSDTTQPSTEDAVSTEGDTTTTQDNSTGTSTSGVGAGGTGGVGGGGGSSSSGS